MPGVLAGQNDDLFLLGAEGMYDLHAGWRESVVGVVVQDLE